MRAVDIARGIFVICRFQELWEIAEYDADTLATENKDLYQRATKSKGITMFVKAVTHQCRYPSEIPGVAKIFVMSFASYVVGATSSAYPEAQMTRMIRATAWSAHTA